MIRDLDALVFALHNARGVYAVLVGSGVSRAAGIPTGWEVIEDLIRKLAKAQGEMLPDDPVGWYRSQTGEEPNYSGLLEKLASSKAERQALLKAYFEPTEEEREQGIKVPSKAHRAIARLARTRVVRVILTTNFDRLLETALADEGVVPTVLSTPSAMEGAPPLVHTSCTLVKLHGDYLDTRIKNTEAELEKYDRRQNRLLRQTLDEYGLIVCGWSAQWDAALYDAISRARNQRYTTFWAVRRGRLTTEAEALVKLRQARTVPIEDADSFFQTVTDRLEALEEFDRPHPISKEIAVAQVKKYLPDDSHRIQLHDLIHSETERAYAQLSVANFPTDRSVTFDESHLSERLERFDATVEILEAMLAIGAYWGSETQVKLWVRTLDRIGTPEEPSGPRLNVWEDLQWYPATKLFYAAGIGALAAESYGILWKLLTTPKVKRPGREPQLLALKASPWCIHGETLNRIMGANYYVPGSERLLVALRETFRSLVPAEDEWTNLFDRFEYLKALATFRSGEQFYVGRFGHSSWRGGGGPVVEIAKQVSEQKEDWPPLTQGYFDGSLPELEAAMMAVNEQAMRKSYW